MSRFSRIAITATVCMAFASPWFALAFYAFGEGVLFALGVYFTLSVFAGVETANDYEKNRKSLEG